VLILLSPQCYDICHLAISDNAYGDASSLFSLAEEIDEEGSTHDCSDDSDGQLALEHSAGQKI